MPLQGVQQRGFLAADVSARASVQDDVEIEARSEDALAEEPSRVGLADSGVHAPGAKSELATAVDEGLVGLVRPRRDRDAFDQLVRIHLGQLAVLEGSRLPFVVVDDDVLRKDVFGNERPLHPGREARAAAAAQPSVLDQADRLVRRGVRHDLPSGPITIVV